MTINSQVSGDDSQNESHCSFNNMFDMYVTLASITPWLSCIDKDADRWYKLLKAELTGDYVSILNEIFCWGVELI